MRARSKSFARNILRVFEIALFFAISVLGFGLLAKTSSASSKDKSRNHPSDVRKNLGCFGHDRELRELGEVISTTSEQHLSFGNQDQVRILPDPQEVMHAYHLPDEARLTRHDSRHTPSYSLSDSSPQPYNLFQQNPVLLI